MKNTDRFICDNISREGNKLYFAGQSVAELAEEYGTPLYLMDEDRIRRNCRMYRSAMKQHYRQGSGPHYASKACSFKQIYRIMQEEDMGIDVVSAGEIYTAYSVGFDMARACFHGNSKTDGEIRYALDHGVGTFVVDNTEELIALDREAGLRGKKQNILLRITPGIDPHTYEAISTGKVDSKFGSAIETGQAEQFVRLTLTMPHITLLGYHCHVGSQVFTEDVFERTASVMLQFAADVKKQTGFSPAVLDLGGGYGVRYTLSDPQVSIADKIAENAKAVHAECDRLGLEEPVIWMEPGRSIVADAGMTVYRVSSVKKITGYKNYIAIDGGMTDNPRYALYRASYTCLPADRMDEPAEMPCDLVGRCCESGDIIQPRIVMPESVSRGDLVAVCTTGAYNYSMASNYNRVPRPAVVMLRNGEARLAVRRETVEDLTALDL